MNTLLIIILIIYLLGVLACYLIYRSTLYYMQMEYPNYTPAITTEKECIKSLYKNEDVDNMWLFLLFSWFGILAAITIGSYEDGDFDITLKSFKTLKK